MTAPGGVSRWTHRFAVGSALSAVALQVAFLFGRSYRSGAVVGLFGAVLPMVFGMAYLLVPSYVGRTLSTRRLPGVHFLLTYAAVGLLAGHEFFGAGPRVRLAGVLLWSAGVAVFVGTLLRTVAPAITAATETLRSSETRPQRSTRLALAAVPVAVGYLVVGTVGLLSTVPGVEALVEPAFPAVVHFYGTGFAALLVFALGIKLMTGFFHVAPPTRLSWLVLVCGAVAPGVLATSFWRPPWFAVGAGLEFVAMAGYAGLVAAVAYRTDYRRVGLYSIGLGAFAGLVGVGVVAVGVVAGASPRIAVHVPVVLDGFLLLTIVGYAYQFFPVTNGQFPGASRPTVLSTILLLGLGTAVQALGAGSPLRWLRPVGAGLALLGTSGYAYLLARRLL